LKWFKLLLESNDEHVQSGTPLPPGMTAMDVTRDFLSALYQHAIGTLWRQNGQAVMSMTKVDFVLTVPAVWSDTAKQSVFLSLSLSSSGLIDGAIGTG